VNEGSGGDAGDERNRPKNQTTEGDAKERRTEGSGPGNYAYKYVKPF
jgi:hypothetical protein